MTLLDGLPIPALLDAFLCSRVSIIAAVYFQCKTFYNIRSYVEPDIRKQRMSSCGGHHWRGSALRGNTVCPSRDITWGSFLSIPASLRSQVVILV